MSQKLPDLSSGQCIDKKLKDESKLILGREETGLEDPEKGITDLRLMLDNAVFAGICAENLSREELCELWNGGIEDREDFFRLSEETRSRILEQFSKKPEDFTGLYIQGVMQMGRNT